MEMSGKSRIRCTAQQVKLLTDYMATHPRLAQGEFTSGPQGRLYENRQWKELRAMLSEHGPDKSIDKWKVTWRDLRRKIRIEESVSKRATNSTGNATVEPVLTDQAKKKIGKMGTEVIRIRAFRIQGSEESGIGSTPALSSTPCRTVLPAEVFELSCDEDENKSSISTLDETQAEHTFGEASAQNPSQQRATEQQHPRPPRARTAQDTRARTLALGNERLQRQRRQRARANQFLEAELQTNDTLRDIADQLAIANRHSAMRSRLIYKEKLWRLRTDLFK